jgi:unsaturated rhamnogalacturonyl hydrolase
MKRLLMMCCACLVLGKQLPAQTNTSAATVLNLMEKVADWQLLSWQRQGMRKEKWDWTNGACYTGFMALNSVANDQKYLRAMLEIGRSLNWNTGPKRMMADDYCVGQLFSQLYALYQDPAMIISFRALADSIASLPHDESLEWKNDIQVREWAWCDALFMGPPALAYLSTATGDEKYLELASRLWWKTTDYLYDTTEHLFSRDGRFLTQKEANGKKMFWSRGNGWVMGGLVRMLQNMPEDFPSRARFLDLYKKMASTIAHIQHADGSWHAALLDSVSYPVKETSGTGFYCYALCWGINQGLLSFDDFFPVVSKAWASLVQSVHPDGKLGFVQQIGEKPEAVDFNSTEVYGVGSFLLAGSEMIKLLVRHTDKNVVIPLYNPLGLERKEEIVSISWSKVRQKMDKPDIHKIKITDPLTGNEIHYQWEFLGGKDPVNVLALVNIMMGSWLFLEFSTDSPALMIPRTYARFVPERLDDFAWENDRIAFRMYGKALEGKKDNGYGLDVWVKRTRRMILNERYRRGDYHTDHGDGMDYYDVGHTLGAGNIAPFLHDTIWYSNNFHRWKILDNGPLRSSFQLDYDQWNAAGQSVFVSKIISLDAGSQLNRIEAVFHFSDSVLPVVVGIVKRKGPGSECLDEQHGIMAYWEPTDKSDGTTGVACLFSKAVEQMLIREDQFLSELRVEPDRSLTYYAGAVWDKAGQIRNSKEWFDYVQGFKEKLNHPLEITW